MLHCRSLQSLSILLVSGDHCVRRLFFCLRDIFCCFAFYFVERHILLFCFLLCWETYFVVMLSTLLRDIFCCFAFYFVERHILLFCFLLVGQCYSMRYLGFPLSTINSLRYSEFRFKYLPTILHKYNIFQSNYLIKTLNMKNNTLLLASRICCNLAFNWKTLIKKSKHVTFIHT